MEGQDSHCYCLYSVRPGWWRALPFGYKCGDASVKLMVPDVGVEARGGSASVEGIVHLIGTHRNPSNNTAVVTAEVRGVIVETGLPMVFEPRNALITEPGF